MAEPPLRGSNGTGRVLRHAGQILRLQVRHVVGPARRCDELIRQPNSIDVRIRLDRRLERDLERADVGSARAGVERLGAIGRCEALGGLGGTERDRPPGVTAMFEPDRGMCVQSGKLDGLDLTQLAGSGALDPRTRLVDEAELCCRATGADHGLSAIGLVGMVVGEPRPLIEGEGMGADLGGQGRDTVSKLPPRPTFGRTGVGHGDEGCETFVAEPPASRRADDADGKFCGVDACCEPVLERGSQDRDVIRFERGLLKQRRPPTVDLPRGVGRDVRSRRGAHEVVAEADDTRGGHDDAGCGEQVDRPVRSVLIPTGDLGESRGRFGSSRRSQDRSHGRRVRPHRGGSSSEAIARSFGPTGFGQHFQPVRGSLGAPPDVRRQRADIGPEFRDDPDAGIVVERAEVDELDPAGVAQDREHGCPERRHRLARASGRQDDEVAGRASRGPDEVVTEREGSLVDPLDVVDREKGRAGRLEAPVGRLEDPYRFGKRPGRRVRWQGIQILQQAACSGERHPALRLVADDLDLAKPAEAPPTLEKQPGFADPRFAGH